MKKIKRLGLLFVAAAFVLASCGGEEKKEKKNDAQEVNNDNENEGVAIPESDDIDFHLPSPLQIAYIFKNSGLEYTPGLTNDQGKVENYVSKYHQLLNFGIYSADLAYCVENGKSQDAKNYLTAVKALAEKIGMNSVFENQGLLERFDNNISNKDSVEQILIDVHEKTEMYLEDNELKYFATIQFAGAWIEGMYLGSQNALTKKNDDLGMMLIEQLGILSNLVKGLKSSAGDISEVTELANALEDLKNSMEALESVKKFDQGGQIVHLTDEELNMIAEKVKALRDSIVNV
jgi:methyl-accepting chemotaxis protein